MGDRDDGRTGVNVGYRIFINGFPKAGTHLVEQMVQTIAPPMSEERPWLGSFQGHAWTEDWVTDYKLFRNMGLLIDGSYAKGHMGYRRDIELFLWGIGATVLFVYRDPRDVAVSQVYHIFSEDGRHPEKEPYREAGIEGALRMVIEGYQGSEAGVNGPNYYPGVMARWKHYAPWLDVPWVLSMRFESLVNNAEVMAKNIIMACVARASLKYGKLGRIAKTELNAAIERMVAAGKDREKSPTFRKGKIGGWRDYFDAGIVDLWKKNDPDDWTSRLGYEW